jgi:hypothetical protein
MTMIRDSILEHQPRSALQYDRIAEIEGSMRDAVQLKFIDKPLTKAQLDELIQIPANPN